MDVMKERLSDSARKAKRNLLLYGLLATVIGSGIVAPGEGRLSIEGFGLTTSAAWVYTGLAILIIFNHIAYWVEGGWDGMDAPWRNKVLLAPRAAIAPGSYEGSSTTPRNLFDHVQEVLKDERLENRSEHWREAKDFPGADTAWREKHWTHGADQTVSEMLASLSWWDRRRLEWVAARYSRYSKPVVFAPLWDVSFPNGLGLIGLCFCIARLIMLLPGVGPFCGLSI